MNNEQLQKAIDSTIVAIKEVFNSDQPAYGARTAVQDHLIALYKIQAYRAAMINKRNNEQS